MSLAPCDRFESARRQQHFRALAAYGGWDAEGDLDDHPA